MFKGTLKYCFSVKSPFLYFHIINDCAFETVQWNLMWLVDKGKPVHYK